MTRHRDIVACWLLVAGYAFLAIAGHGGLHALSGEEHAHCFGHTRHHHDATADHAHTGHCHHSQDGHVHHHHTSKHAPDDMPQAPAPVEHDDDCLICVVLSSPVQVTISVTFEPLDSIGSLSRDGIMLSHGSVDTATPPVRGPPVA